MTTSPTTGYPTPEFLEALEANAVRFARSAGAIILQHFQTNVSVEYKSRGNRDPVTAADNASEEYLQHAIHEAYPSHSVLGEEGHDIIGENADFLWALDPLDGTVNFLNGLPFFAVSIGVLFRGEPVAAAVYVPTSSVLTEGVFHARLGGEAFFEERRLAVCDNPLPEGAQLSSLPGHYWGQMRFSGELRRSLGEVRTLGSIAVELALTASGTMQYAVFNAPKIWDVAGGVLLVKCAGGLALSQSRRGQPWLPLPKFEPMAGAQDALDGYRRWSQTVIAGNPEIAWALAEHMYRPSHPLQPVRELVRKVKQLPLWR